MSTIVLAHGFFGFGSLLPGPLAGLQPIHYFNGVAKHFREDLHLNVFEPQTNPIGPIRQRATGAQLPARSEVRSLFKASHFNVTTAGCSSHTVATCGEPRVA